jgi:hypothetical protein
MMRMQQGRLSDAKWTALRRRLLRSLGVENLQMDERNFTYIFYGFLAALLVLVGYGVSLAGRERRLRKEIERIKHMIEDREKK